MLQQTVGIPMGTNCAPLVADLILYSCEAVFIQEVSEEKRKKLVRSFNSRFGDFVERIYPIELEIKDTTEGRLRTKPYDKRDDFNFPILNFPFMCNIPESPAYGVYISQLIRYSRARGS